MKTIEEPSGNRLYYSKECHTEWAESLLRHAKFAIAQYHAAVSEPLMNISPQLSQLLGEESFVFDTGFSINTRYDKTVCELAELVRRKPEDMSEREISILEKLSKEAGVFNSVAMFFPESQVKALNGIYSVMIPELGRFCDSYMDIFVNALKHLQESLDMKLPEGSSTKEDKILHNKPLVYPLHICSAHALLEEFDLLSLAEYKSNVSKMQKEYWDEVRDIASVTIPILTSDR
ncbi:MAG TPA: hypothetical protein VJI75_00520 [Candidatus Nanoarchaeia archaeon]|nr:hypothetical protein [Candidatus Nanoarchaeia archaeon]